MLHRGGQNEKWPSSGPGGYMTLAICGIPKRVGQNRNRRTSGNGGDIIPAVYVVTPGGATPRF